MNDQEPRGSKMKPILEDVHYAPQSASTMDRMKSKLKNVRKCIKMEIYLIQLLV